MTDETNARFDALLAAMANGTAPSAVITPRRRN